ncbi:hypothetical protein F5Y19DRAFT_425681 [Xylariaceae sp. FL1651]|nr:hypothetical protein F5Y19DRAFT_425681 [Xylariaceae sp. FL1651]
MPENVSSLAEPAYFDGSLLEVVSKDRVSEQRLNDIAVRVVAPCHRLSEHHNFFTLNLSTVSVLLAY